MSAVAYYRDDRLPFMEIKSCLAGIHASKMHAHEEFSCGLIMGGASAVGGAGRDCLVKAGDIILIPAGVMHDCRPRAARDWRFSMLFLKQAWLAAALGASPADSTLSVRTPAAGEYRRLADLFHVLRSDADAMEKESHLVWAIGGLLDASPRRRPHAPPPAATAKPLRAVEEYIRAHYLERITLDDLAGVANLSKYSLLRGFKRVHAAPPHAFQTVLRINHAKRELRTCKDKPIAAIAQEAGFYDQSHFDKTFRQYTGTTPLGYRLSAAKH